MLQFLLSSAAQCCRFLWCASPLCFIICLSRSIDSPFASAPCFTHQIKSQDSSSILCACLQFNQIPSDVRRTLCRELMMVFALFLTSDEYMRTGTYLAIVETMHSLLHFSLIYRCRLQLRQRR